MIPSHDHRVTDIHAEFRSPQKVIVSTCSWRRLNTGLNTVDDIKTKCVTSVGSSSQSVVQDQSCTHRTLHIVVNDVFPCSAARQNTLLN